MIRKQMSKILAASAIVCAATGVSVVNAAELEVNDVQVKTVEGRSTSTVGTVINCPSGLNLRKSASTNSTVLTILPNGAKVNILSTSNGWHKVEYNNMYGYVSATYIKVSGTNEVAMSATGTVYNTNGEGLNLRKSPSTSSAIVVTLKEGAKLTITAQNGSWYKVKCGNYTGYVASKYVKVDSSSNSNSSTGETAMSATGTVYNTNGEGLNLRKSPSTSSAIIVGLNEGTKLTITAQNGNWYKVKYGNYTGYVSSKYVKVDSSSNSSNSSNSSAGETAMSATGTIYNTNGEGANLRKSASTSSSIILGLREGTTVTITAKNGDWYKVKYGSYTGYVYSKYVKVGSSSNSNNNSNGNSNSTTNGDVAFSSKAYVGDTGYQGLNLRKSPSTSASIITTIPQGAVVTVTAKNGDWYKVTYAGNTGYVHSSYIVLGEKPSKPGNNTSATFEDVFNVMKAHIGSPYVWGGSGEYITDSSIATLRNRFPEEAAKGAYDTIDRKFYNSGYRAFDCSGLMQWGFAQVGIKIGRTTYNQVNDGYAVSKADAQPGDLLITNSQGHVGMYIGNGQWIESPYSGAYIRISNVNWSNIGYVRRVL